MSDRYSASIRIGGDLPRRHIARICGLLGLDLKSEAALLPRVEGGWLRHEDNEATWGEFCDLETACRELGLSYVRESDGYYDQAPQAAFWQPGMEGPESVTTDGSGGMLVSMDTLCEVREHLRAGRIAEALALLEEAIVEVPDLPPFRLLSRVAKRRKTL